MPIVNVCSCFWREEAHRKERTIAGMNELYPDTLEAERFKSPSNILVRDEPEDDQEEDEEKDHEEEHDEEGEEDEDGYSE